MVVHPYLARLPHAKWIHYVFNTLVLVILHSHMRFRLYCMTFHCILYVSDMLICVFGEFLSVFNVFHGHKILAFGVLGNIKLCAALLAFFSGHFGAPSTSPKALPQKTCKDHVDFGRPTVLKWIPKTPKTGLREFALWLFWETCLVIIPEWAQRPNFLRMLIDWDM